MFPTKLAFLAGCIIMLMTKTVQADDPSGKVLNYGIVKTSNEKVAANEDSTSGFSRTAENVYISRTTEKIPLNMGDRFGFEFELKGLPKDEIVILKKVVKHPSMTNRSGMKKEGFTRDYRVQTDQFGEVKHITWYGFDHDFEMVEGEWKFELKYMDKTLAERTFTTVKP